MIKLTPGDKAWLVISLWVSLYDIWAFKSKKESLSGSFQRSLLDSRRMPATATFWIYLVGHLYGVIPKRYDPLRRWFETSHDIWTLRK